MRRLMVLFLFWLAAAGGACAQGADPSSGVATTELAELRDMAVSLEGEEERLTELRRQLREAVDGKVTDGEVEEVREAVAKQRELVESLRTNLLCAASGIEEGEYAGELEKPVTLQENLEDIVEPISRAMRELTEGPRALDKLREDLEAWESRQELVAGAKARIAKLIEEAPEGSQLREDLTGFQQLWQTREAETASQVQVLRHHLEERVKSTPSGWEAVSGGIADFWRSRGMNVLIALAIAVFVYFLIKWSYRQFVRVSPVHRGKRGFGARAVDLSVGLLSVVLAVFAAVLVFYLRGDWLLLALAVVMLLGIAWASKTAVPPFLNQLKLVLNLGAVRQGERVVYDGVAWRVDKLAFYCEFRNPELEGGELRLSVQEVLDMHSREASPREPWFPTKENEWVILGDGTYGKVVEQTPEQVVVLQLGGSRKTYPTSDFIGQCPKNLSHGFRVSSLFGIDYAHQPISTTEVPGVFQAHLEKELVRAFAHENVRSVKVEFASAGASSLDYEVIADFGGDVASRLNVIERMIQRLCVDVCNERGWGIPFTQITLHQAGGGGEEE